MFDRGYFQRYYHEPGTAVTSRAEMRARAELIAAAVRHTGLPVRRILDAGCGLGLMRAPLLRRLPGARYVGLDSSAYLCRRYGWRRGELQSLPTRVRYELVVCYDVLQYLDTGAARRALRKLAAVCRGMLYFSALTSGDWRHNCDRTRTDHPPGLRAASWYRRELERHFEPLGCGLWLRRGAPVTLWELERPAS